MDAWKKLKLSNIGKGCLKHSFFLWFTNWWNRFCETDLFGHQHICLQFKEFHATFCWLFLNSFNPTESWIARFFPWTKMFIIRKVGSIFGGLFISITLNHTSFIIKLFDASKRALRALPDFHPFHRLFSSWQEPRTWRFMRLVGELISQWKERKRPLRTNYLAS